MTTKTERCPTCGSDERSKKNRPLGNSKYNCTDPWHTVSSEASPTAATVARQVPEWALKAALEIWEDNHLEPENATEDSIKERNCKLWAEIVARHAEIGPTDTTGRPESTGFEVLIKIHTKQADKAFSSPEFVRFKIGKALDLRGIEEEIDYTLEVRRVYR